MNTSSQKRIAARVLKCGTSRVKLKESQDVEDALTRQDVRDLVQKGEVYKIQKKGTSRFAAKKKLVQKKRGRMRGMGKRKGTTGARKKDKTKWMELVRAQRSLLKELRDKKQIDISLYRKLYMRVKGGFFRNKSHIIMYLKDKELLKPVDKKTVKNIKAKKPVVKKAAPKTEKRAVKKAVKKAARKTTKKAATKKTAKKPMKRGAAKSAKKATVKKAVRKPVRKPVAKNAAKKKK